MNLVNNNISLTILVNNKSMNLLKAVSKKLTERIANLKSKLNKLQLMVNVSCSLLKSKLNKIA